MSFLNPFWLFSLLALPLMAALYFLKVRPRLKQTNAFFLWQQIYEEKSSSAFFRRLRDLWSLLLMLLALLLISLALANPVFEQADSRDLIIVVDHSASMQALESGSTRLEHAKELAVTIVRALNGTRQAAVASLSDELYFHSHLSSHPRELLEAIDQIEPTELPLSASAMRQLGETISGEESPYRIIFISDGGPGVDLPSTVEPLLIDSQSIENVGIIAADLQWVLGGSQQASCYIRVLNSGATEVAVDLELVHVDTERLAKLMPLVVPAGEALEVLFDVEHAKPGHWRVQLVHEDALEVDNQVVVGLNPMDSIGVAINVKSTWFFEKCVEAFSRSGGVLGVSSSSEHADIELFEGEVPDVNSHALVFKPEGTSPLWASVGDTVDVSITQVEAKGHPFLQHLEFDHMKFKGVRELALPKGALVLLASEQGVPVLYKTSYAGHSVIVANFDPDASDFFLSPWFPVMVHAAAVHLADRGTELGGVVATGTRIQLSDEANFKGVITDPDEQLITVEGIGQFEFTEVGAYRLDSAGGSRYLGAGLLSAHETQLRSSEHEPLLALATGWPFAWLLLLLALIILSVECLLYHRRKLG